MWSISNEYCTFKKINVHKSYTKSQFSKIIRGFLPESMEDRWFIYYEDYLYVHRSWSGKCIYKLKFVQKKEYFLLTQIYVDVEYSEEDGNINSVLEIIEKVLLENKQYVITKVEDELEETIFFTNVRRKIKEILEEYCFELSSIEGTLEIVSYVSLSRARFIQKLTNIIEFSIKKELKDNSIQLKKKIEQMNPDNVVTISLYEKDKNKYYILYLSQMDLRFIFLHSL